jgi:hypothetical protein
MIDEAQEREEKLMEDLIKLQSEPIKKKSLREKIRTYLFKFVNR